MPDINVNDQQLDERLSELNSNQNETYSFR
jgi:hypothetical protein